LASKYCQRRPFRLKRIHRLREPSGSSTPKEGPSGFALFNNLAEILERPLQRMTPERSHREVISNPSYTFSLCRHELAQPQSASKAKHVIWYRSVSHPMLFGQILEENLSIERIETEALKSLMLSRSVINVRTQAENIGSLLFDAQRDCIAISDREGFVFIHNFEDPKCPEISSIPLTGRPKYLQTSFCPSGDPKNSKRDWVDTVSMFHLDASCSLDRLVTCCTDGSVRIWDHCTEPGACNLRIAFQAVPICTPPSYVLAPACFDWQAMIAQLFSAGISLPGIVQQMDLESEKIVQKVRFKDDDTTSFVSLVCN